MNILKNLDKSLYKKLGIIIGCVVGIFVLIIIFLIIKNGRLNYNQIENRMIHSAKNYYKDNKDLLPIANNGTVTITTDKLTEEKYLKDLKKLVKNKNDECSGVVTVTKNDDLYLYSATLSCGEKYTTKKVKDVIASNVTTSGDGLYQYNNEFIFKGDNPNNYLSFAGKTWRIIKINNDGSIKIIDTEKRDNIAWDDRYNSDKEYNVGINDYRVSRIRETLKSLLSEINKDNQVYLLKQNLCIGKRDYDEKNLDGTVECSDIVNDDIGLIQINEYALASNSELCKNPTDPECTNYNYLANIGSMWTLNADSKTSYKVYKISNGVILTNAVNSSQPKMVVTINPTVNHASGNGTQEKPYTFK